MNFIIKLMTIYGHSDDILPLIFYIEDSKFDSRNERSRTKRSLKK